MTEPSLKPNSWRSHLLASLRSHHRGLIWALEAFAFLLAGLVILVVAAAYRLNQGPVQLQFLTPQLVAWLDHQVAPFRVSVDTTSLRWMAGDSDLQAYVGGVRVTDSTQGVIASVQSIAFSLDFPSLLVGQLRPTVLKIDAPALKVQRGPAGNFYLRPGVVPKPGSGIPMGHLLAILHAWVERDREDTVVNQALRRIYIHDGAVSIDDQQAGKPWGIFHINMDLNRSTPRYEATADADIDSGQDHSRIDANAGYDLSTLQSRYALRIDPFVPAHWAAFLPEPLDRAAALDLPVGATVSGTVDLNSGAIGSISFSAHAQAGQIRDPHLDHGRFAISKAAVAGRFDVASGQLDLAPITVDLGGPTVASAVTLTGIGQQTTPPRISLGLDLAIHDVPRQGMEGYWPPVPVPKTRAWVLEHVTAGRLKELTLHGAWDIYPGQAIPVVKKFLNGTMRFQGVTLDYLHGLMPAQGLDATAKLDINDIDFDASAAQIGRIILHHGTASITGLNEPDAPSIMTVNLDLAGPASDAIAFISAPRLHVAKLIGIGPDAVSGMLQGPLQVRFPIMKTGDAPASDVFYQGKFHLTDLGVVKGVLGRDITHGDVTLSVDPDHVVIAGAAAISAVPALFTWEDTFSAAAAVRSRLNLTATLDDAGRARLGIDPLPGAVHGAVGVSATATIGRDRVTRAAIGLDFRNAVLSLDDANWAKPAGIPASLTMSAEIADNHWRRIRNLDAHGPGLDVQGDLDFDDSGVVSGARSNHMVIGGTDAAAQVTHGPDGWHVALSGPSIDATAYTNKFDVPSTPEERLTAPPVTIAVTAGRLTLGPARVMKSARFHGRFEHLALQQGDLAAEVGARGHLTFHLDRPEDGGAIAADTDDLGATVADLNMSTHVAGGSATLRGRCVRIDGTRHFSAQLEATDYRLVKAPVLAKILSLASFSSIASLLGGEGVPFSDLSADLTLSDGLLEIDQGRAYGDAIGLVANGSYDFNTKLITLRGTLVPAYFLNGILGDVPFVGKFLAGGTGQGLFGANFKVGGPVGAPFITANPLSILAPGPLRDLFLFQAPKPSTGPSSNVPGAASQP